VQNIFKTNVVSELLNKSLLSVGQIERVMEYLTSHYPNYIKEIQHRNLFYINVQSKHYN